MRSPGARGRQGRTPSPHMVRCRGAESRGEGGGASAALPRGTSLLRRHHNRDPGLTAIRQCRAADLCVSRGSREECVDRVAAT